MKKLSPAVPHEDHLNKVLKNATVAAGYLNLAIKRNDSHQVLKALGNIARAHGITNIAGALDLQRESVSRMLSKNGNPALTNFLKILDASGLVIQVRAKAAA